jgi:hypothetical protein
MMLWNTFILASALAEIVGCTPLPSIIERLHGCYHISEQHLNIIMKLRRLMAVVLQHSGHTTSATPMDLWNCIISASGLSFRCFEGHPRIIPKTLKKKDTQCHSTCHPCYMKNHFKKSHPAVVLFTTTELLHSYIFMFVICPPKNHKSKLDEARSWGISSWHQSNDDIILTTKKRIINYLLHLFRVHFPQPLPPQFIFWRYLTC